MPVGLFMMLILPLSIACIVVNVNSCWADSWFPTTKYFLMSFHLISLSADISSSVKSLLSQKSPRQTSKSQFFSFDNCSTQFIPEINNSSLFENLFPLVFTMLDLTLQWMSVYMQIRIAKFSFRFLIYYTIKSGYIATNDYSSVKYVAAVSAIIVSVTSL